jgi:hypothetical protein
MATLTASPAARLRAEALRFKGHPVDAIPARLSRKPTHKASEAIAVSPKPKPAATPAAPAPSDDLLEAARSCRLGREHRALIEAEDEEALRAARVDEADVRKPIKWRRLNKLERQRRNEVWQTVKAAFPVFRHPDNPVPLKIGIREDLAAGIGAKDARRILAMWCRRAEYQAALIAGAPRYDLTGVPVGEVAVHKNPNPSAESASTITQGSRADVQPRGEESGGDGSQHMVWTADQDVAALPAR